MQLVVKFSQEGEAAAAAAAAARCCCIQNIFLEKPFLSADVNICDSYTVIFYYIVFYYIFMVGLFL